MISGDLVAQSSQFFGRFFAIHFASIAVVLFGQTAGGNFASLFADRIWPCFGPSRGRSSISGQSSGNSHNCCAVPRRDAASLSKIANGVGKSEACRVDLGLFDRGNTNRDGVPEFPFQSIASSVSGHGFRTHPPSPRPLGDLFVFPTNQRVARRICFYNSARASFTPHPLTHAPPSAFALSFPEQRSLPSRNWSLKLIGSVQFPKPTCGYF